MMGVRFVIVLVVRKKVLTEMVVTWVLVVEVTVSVSVSVNISVIV